ncbi:MAG: DUF1491 family protein [Bdellovibrionales bacterium]
MNDLPTSLWVESHIAQCQSNCIPVYIVNKGAYSGATVLLKINGLGNGFQILTQVRDIDGTLCWMHAIKAKAGKEEIAESEIDAYIRRSIERDPDVWAIEIEDKELKNPFGGNIIG